MTPLIKASMAIKQLASDARELAERLDRRAAQLAEGSTPNASATELFSWAVNDIENYIRNVNFAGLVRRANELN